MSDLAAKLELAIETVIRTSDTGDEDVCILIQRASEAVTMLKVYEGYQSMHNITAENYKQAMYDLVRTAAGAGWCPDKMGDNIKLKE